MIAVNITYTDSLGPEADIPALVGRLADRLQALEGLDEEIRVEAQRVTDYRVVAGEGDWSSLAAVVRVSAAKANRFRAHGLHELVAVTEAHFSELFRRRSIAISFEVQPIEPENLVERLHARPPNAEDF
jgi:5-carboxymethyl-2-hydroxymuconate isomerase